MEEAARDKVENIEHHPFIRDFQDFVWENPRISTKERH
jgi:hypothetical protein